MAIEMRIVESTWQLEDELRELIRAAGITSGAVLEEDDGDIEVKLLAPKSALPTFEALAAGTTFLIEAVKDGPALELGDLGRRPIKGGEVVLEQEVVPDGHGADDYEKDEGLALRIRADDGSGPVGHVDLNVTEEGVHVRFLEVSAEHRRRGIGGALLDEVEARYGAWSGNGFTDLGSALMESRA